MQKGACEYADRKRQGIVLHHQCAQLESLKVELAEFIRKNDYRFRDGIICEKGDSYRRAAELHRGKHPPATRKELAH